MTEKQFKILKTVEPSVVELTKKEYEKRMGIRPEGSEGKKDTDVGQSVGEDSKKEDDASVSPGTRQEIIKTLQKRGLKYVDLKSKTKQQLLEML